ncbi:MAG: ribosomal protein S21 [Flavobacteriaceae bacterium]|jgi:ribosomal protein S21
MSSKNATNIDITKKDGRDNASSMLRRFSRAIRESGMIPKIKGHRYAERPQSDLKRKQTKLRSLSKTKDFERLWKLGKIKPKKRR